MPDIRNLYLSLPDLTNRLSKISNRFYTMHSSCSFSAREYCVLERMHEIIQKGMDCLIQRLDNDLKNVSFKCSLSFNLSQLKNH
ncbi:hypothetical protein EDC85_02685 [Helicobacter pylori]|nr:hypothetical protein EC557_01730 [Helicobacter pylori]RVZ91976.1 hypothetical protein EDC85_02685 [Helicobacter pylori]